MVEFRCGKMKVDGNGTTVRADPRKGRLTVKKSPEDDLMHLTWTDRSQGLTEDDFIIFPGDAVFEYVEQAKDNAKNNRVYVLKFTSTRKLHFYWMQEPSNEKDAEYAGKVNAYINGVRTPFSSSCLCLDDEQESDPSAPAGISASIGQADQVSFFIMLLGGH
ncbi:hypothetical protein GUITHDRAFT_77823 [Guillardia theta CCMP2712]|uniref:Pru domain-containing protein n=1 Tax=Guillardia theta (strain CCMP2712) TaxID=905079 RepID=L1ING9_GUITC|nr:hypothetical protein GUITHDRAFT_77823 [Guillardia theta CCMP2712]EKX37793.1 hypothetical protein GUITHDRAFT_77823 [Guillardia theta CCMP2712]|eukprot:XP_005824773.1 hypothetical protein GUITHDRAFT_77823 [Guillardia theta CCMP2712]